MKWRKLEVDGKKYYFAVGNQNVIIRHDDNGDIGDKYAAVGFDELAGIPWHVVEHNMDKKAWHVTPTLVGDYILKKLGKNRRGAQEN